jgi:hypothetical protein
MVTLDPFRRYGGESEKVLLPPLETKIGFIGNRSSFAFITPQVMAIRGAVSGKGIVTQREALRLAARAGMIVDRYGRHGSRNGPR